jgi:hypothetical protein
MDGIEHEFEAVGHAQLVENVMQVILYRLFADEQLFTNLFVAKALRDMFHDLLFPIENLSPSGSSPTPSSSSTPSPEPPSGNSKK